MSLRGFATDSAVFSFLHLRPRTLVLSPPRGDEEDEVSFGAEVGERRRDIAGVGPKDPSVGGERDSHLPRADLSAIKFDTLHLQELSPLP